MHACSTFRTQIPSSLPRLCPSHIALSGRLHPLQGDERLPLRTLWGGTLVASPSESSGTSPVGGSAGLL